MFAFLFNSFSLFNKTETSISTLLIILISLVKTWFLLFLLMINLVISSIGILGIKKFAPILIVIKLASWILLIK